MLIGDSALLHVFETVKRDDPTQPQLYRSFQLSKDKLPSVMLPNKACNMIAIGSENPGKGSTNQGGITLIKNFDIDNEEQVVNLSLDAWDDKYVLRKGLHMPLTKNALHYWNTLSPIANDVDFSNVIDKYRTGIFLHPKKMAWSGHNDEELLVNLQENNGLIRINVTTTTTSRYVSSSTAQAQAAVVSYGVKDHSIVPIDLNKNDKDCNLKTYKHLFSMRNPDTIATLAYNDKHYVITANEGDVREFNEFEDKVKAKEIFKGTEFALPHMKVPKSIFNPDTNITSESGSTALFNKECEGDDCVSDAQIVLGSNAIDYETDPTNPIFLRMVLAGGRGWSIYELPDDPENLLKLVFDSGDAIESAGCEHYPWAHNAQYDEEMAPAGDNFPNNTLWEIADEELRDVLSENNDPEGSGCDDRGDGLPGACPMTQLKDLRSPKDGASVEQIVIGEACGRLLAATAGEKSSIAQLFDITELTAPSLFKVFHLSPASEHKSAGIAYNDGTIGEIDPENSVFLTADKSPTGKPSVMFVGAFSGTVSFWEFECEELDAVGDEEEASANLRSAGLVRGGLPSVVAMALASIAFFGLF